MSRFGRSRLSESDYSDLVTSPLPSEYVANSPSRRISTNEVRWGIRSPNLERSGSSESLDDRGSVCSNFSRQDGEFIPTRTTVVSVKPAANAMQFVKSGPAKLVLSAQEQLKKAEEIKKVKMVVKEDDEDWQKNLEGWKMSRRKRQEPVIQRVSEVKKFEQEEEMRLLEAKARKNRTFSQMLGRSNGRKQSLGFYPDDDQGGSFDFGQSVDEPYTPLSEPERPSFPKAQTIEESHIQTGDCESPVNGESVQSVKPSSVEPSVVSDSRSESSDFSPVKRDLSKDCSPERKERLVSPKKESYVLQNSHSTSRIYQSSVRVEKRYTEFNGSREGSVEPVHKESVVQQRYLSQLESSKEKIIPEKKPTDEITANVKMRRSLFERQSSGEVVTSTSDARRKSGEISEGLRSKLQALTTAENSILSEEAKFLSQRRKSLEMSDSLKSKLQALAAEETMSQSRVTPEKDDTFREKLKNFQTHEKTPEYKKPEPKFPENIDSAYSVKSKLANFEQKQEPEKVAKPPPGRLASELIRPKSGDKESGEKRPEIVSEPVRNGSSELRKVEVNRTPEPEVRKTRSVESGSKPIESGPKPVGSGPKPVESGAKPEVKQSSELKREGHCVELNVERSSVEKVENWVESVEQRSRIPVPTARPVVKAKVDSDISRPKIETDDRGSRPSSSTARREELVNQKPWEPEAVLLAPSAKFGPPKSKPPPPPPEESSDDEKELPFQSESHLKVGGASPLRSLDDSPQSLESAAFVNLEAHSPVASQSYQDSPTGRSGASEARRRLEGVDSPRYIVSPLDTESDELTRKEMEIIESLEKEEEARLKRLVKKSQGFDPSSLDASIASDDQESASSMNESVSSTERLGYPAQESDYLHVGHTRTGSDPFRVVPRPSVAPSEPTRTSQVESRITGSVKQTVQETRISGQNPKEAPRRMLPKAPSVDYLDHEAAGLKPVRKEEAKRDVSKHWLVQEAEQRLLESQIRRSNDSLPSNDYPPSTLHHQMSSQMFPRSSSMGSITRPPTASENVLSQSVSGSIPGPNFKTRGPSPSAQEAHMALSGSRSGPLRSSSTDFLTRNYWETETESRLLAEEPVKRAQSASHLQSDYMNLRDLQKGMVAQTRGSYADSSRSSNRSSQMSGSSAAPQVPALPPRNASSEKSRDRMLSVSGKKKCSQCGQELGRGAAMIIETLRLYYHMDCFRCCVCQSPLGSGLAGTDVRVRNAMLHCRNCYSNDDGFKFSKV